jgi:hypothetical protein
MPLMRLTWAYTVANIWRAHQLPITRPSEPGPLKSSV